MDGVCLSTGLQGISQLISVTSNQEAKETPIYSYFKQPFRSLFSGSKNGVVVKGVAEDDAVLIENRDCKIANGDQLEGEDDNWVSEILHVKYLKSEENEVSSSPSCSVSEACDCDYENEENEIEFDRSSFSKLLKKVSLSDVQLYAQLSYLGKLAYSIPTIKPSNLLRRYCLRYVKSSIEVRKQLVNLQSQNQHSITVQEQENGAVKLEDLNNNGREKVNEFMTVVMNDAKYICNNLNSIVSCPCEWYICDEDQGTTRLFVIQGSETLASWQANLLFDPIQFEGTEFYVHRGIYETAKQMYQQMLPEIRAHMRSHGTRARFRFTGHSLGGSLSLLINLMLLIKNEVPLCSLLPVVTFGSPNVMCRGDQLLSKLGLPKSHVQSIIMHRDIVPRAFSCRFPDHVVELFKVVCGNFQSYPCLNNQKVLYSPMGEMLILQPDASFSPHHDFLPSGIGLYLLRSDSIEDEKQPRAAKTVFLNSPHPLEILSDQFAYGSGGSIFLNHDINSYVICLCSLVRQELFRMRKDERKQRRKVWWPRVIGESKANTRQGDDLNFPWLVRTGMRLSKLVSSHHMHLLMVVVPARMLLMSAHGTTGGLT